MSSGDYISIIQQTFDDRMRSNPSYSLRSFARDLGLAPSTLSEILRKKKGISPQRASSIAKALRLPDWQASYFRDLVIRSTSRSATAKTEAAKRIRNQSRTLRLRTLKAETARALTSWLDLAILECVNLKSFDGTIESFCEILGQPHERVSASLERLQKVGLLKIHPDGTLEDLSPFFSTSDGIPSESIRAFHKELLKTMDERISNHSITDRTMKAVIFSLEDSQLPEAKRIIDDAVSKVVALAGKAGPKKDHILCFSSQLFYFSKPSGGNS